MDLSIDPGLTSGYSLWEGTSLIDCGVWRNYKSTPLATLPKRVLIELPQVYPHDPVNPNNLITLAVGVGRYVERFDGAAVILVKPKEWKGQTPKPVHHARILAKLTLDEQDLVRARGGLSRPDMMDALGLGQWARASGLW